MFCPSCGKEIPDIAKFCPMCGMNFSVNIEQSAPAPQPKPVMQPEDAPVAQHEIAAQPESMPQYEPVAQTVPQYEPAPRYQAAPAAAQAAPKKKPNMKLIGIIAAAAAAVILLIVLIVTLGGSAGGSLKYIGTRYDYYTNNDDTVYVFYGDKLITEIDVDADNSDLVVSASHSLDYSTYAMITGDGCLYYFKGATPNVVSDENAASYILSRDGSTLVYVINDDGDRTLNIYRSGKSTEIAELEYPDEDDFNSYYFNYIVSPDGGTVIYTQYDKDGDYVTYGYKGGEPFEIDDNLYPHYVTDGGKYAYLEDVEKDRLLVYKDLMEEAAKLNDFGSISKVTYDRSTIIYWDDKEETYLVYSPSMEEPVELIDENFYMVTASNTIGAYDSFDDILIITSSDGNIYRFVLKNGKYEKIKIASGAENYKLSVDGKRLAFAKNGSLYIVNNVKASKPESVKLFKDMGDNMSISGSDDLKYLYFYDEDGNLMFSKGKEGDAAEIADDDVYRYVVAADGTCIYTYDHDYDDNTAELYYSVKGKQAVQVTKPDEASSLYRMGDVVFVIIDDELYVTKDGKTYNITEADLG